MFPATPRAYGIVVGDRVIAEASTSRPVEVHATCGRTGTAENPGVVAFVNQQVSMTNDQRVQPRVCGPFKASWDGNSGNRPIIRQVSDLSSDGCFIETLGQLPRGHRLRLRLELPREGWISLSGEIVRWDSDRGFALRFLDLTTENQGAITRTVEYLREKDVLESRAHLQVRGAVD